MRYRTETDSIGSREVPEDAYYGIQSMRAAENFRMTGLHIHPEMVRSMADVKAAAATANYETGALDEERERAILHSCAEMREGKFDGEIIVDPIQGGAGTSLNMNVNEVLANRAIELLGGVKGDYKMVHPNDTSHRRQVLLRMEEKGLDALLVYADREHGANYAYLTGFEPRFEESVLILYRDGSCRLMLGNENLKMCGYSFIKAQPVHVPHFSLPYQPMDTDKSLPELFGKAGLADGMRIGCAGWKWFTSRHDENGQMLDIPSFIVDAVRRLCPDSVLTNAADIFLDPARGLRIFSNANEIAHYEFGAGLASSQVLCALNSVQPGKTEMEIAGEMNCLGQPMTVTMICAAGDRFTDAVVFPRNKKICLGDKFSLTLGLRGGLTSRAAYVAYQREDLEEEVRDYLERAAMPYYRMAVSWYEAVSIGTKCGEIYRMAEELLPREQYHWTLNPGHSTGADEWVSSPMYPGSEVILQSGMMLQMDVIPSVPGYGGANAEDGIAIADEKLRAELREKYPAVWKRMQDRREYMERELGIRLKEEILPLSDLCGYMRPYILNHDYALAKGE